MERDDECPFSKLPSPIITDILIKLPTENIVGCRCVCKSWLKLLSETEFVNLHLQRSQYSQTNLIIINNLSFESKKSFLFNLVEVKDQEVQQLSPQDEQDQDLLQFVPGSKMELPRHGYNVKMVGSVKGLVCLSEFPLFHIWNPTMKQTITIPNPNYNETTPSHPNPNPHKGIVRYGFGTTLVSNKYKVIRVFQELDVLDCQVYTLGEGPWRSIENVPFRYYNHLHTDEHGLFLNGKIYWLTDDFDHRSEFISCLDLEKEVFLQPLPSPPGLIIKDHKSTLNLYKGCLSICDNTNDSEIVIWIMNEYEITSKKKSWIKQIVVPKISVFFDCPRHIDVVRIIKVFKDGTMLLLMRNYVVFSYHPKNNSLTSFDGRDLIGAIKKRTCMFEELYPSLQAMDFVSTILSLNNFAI